MKVYKTRENATIPQYATQGSACFDVRACLTVGERVKSYTPFNKEVDILVKKNGLAITPGTRVLIPTGLIFDIPINHVMEMFIRSSVATKMGLTLVNSIGIIDSDYVDETHIIVHNVSDTVAHVHDGDRLAQCRLACVTQQDIKEIKKKPGIKTDRKGGIGSTGKI
jgi:dUTP pyrophosphatase